MSAGQRQADEGRAWVVRLRLQVCDTRDLERRGALASLPERVGAVRQAAGGVVMGASEGAQPGLRRGEVVRCLMAAAAVRRRAAVVARLVQVVRVAWSGAVGKLSRPRSTWTGSSRKI